jgi:hypothetical protein
MRSSVAPMTSISTYVACTVEGMVRRVVASRAWLGVSAISALPASLYWALIPTVHEEDVYGSRLACMKRPAAWVPFTPRAI